MLDDKTATLMVGGERMAFTRGTPGYVTVDAHNCQTGRVAESAVAVDDLLELADRAREEADQ